MSDERQHDARDGHGRDQVEPDGAQTSSAAHAKGDPDIGSTESHRRASYADPIAPGDPDGVLGPPPDAARRE